MNKKRYARLDYAGYVIFRYKNICLLSHYGKGKIRPYFEDLMNSIMVVLSALLIIAVFPLNLIMMIYKFIPKLRFIEK